MTASLHDHVAFWQALRDGMSPKRGLPLIQCLAEAKAQAAGTPIENVAEALSRAIRAGKTLSEAMAESPAFFSPAVRTLVRAGEAGGVLDVVAARIMEGLQRGTLPLPGQSVPPGNEVAVFWRAAGLMLACGVPILHALEMLGGANASETLRGAAHAIAAHLGEGGSIVEALATMPELFPQEVRAAIDWGEKHGSVDDACVRIADAIEAGDLVPLMAPPAAESGAPADADAVELGGIESSPVVRLVNLILLQAARDGASDVHFDPMENGFRMRYRIDGVLREMMPPEEAVGQKVIGRLKLMAQMDVTERRRPQDGRIRLEIEGRALDLRVSCTPTIFGERVAVRILDREAAQIDLAQIGLLDADMEQVKALCHAPNGLVICTGPVGSGKTTLLYAMLKEAARPEVCVLSVEDPVEYNIPGVAQTQVRPQIGLSFPVLLRSFLRQDPDVIMVGEVRDLETVQTCVQAALTGHLILTTLHTNNAPSALRRLHDMGLEPFLINGAVEAVIAQRLVRKLCPECRVECEPPLYSLPPDAIEYMRLQKDATFYDAGGCDACRGSGYRGRTAIHEILVMDDHVREAVARSLEPADICKAAIESGTRTMLTNGIEKAARGITSIREVCRVVPV